MPLKDGLPSGEPKTPEDFEFKREAIHSEGEPQHEDSHGTEMGWLVSYADMMTLLFGLFVILFTLATDKSKSVEEVMKKVSDQYFRDAGPQPIPVPVPKKNSEPIPDLVPALTTQITNLKNELSKKESDFKSKSEKLEAQIANFETKKTETSAPKKSDSVTKLKNENQNLKSELEAAQKKANAKQGEVDQLKKEQANKTPAATYMMVLLSWETEKHDLDLQVVDPHSKSFNFKRRQIANEPGQFELDSRFGPGLEMWKAANFLPGNYRAHVVLYAQNGNLAPARAHLKVITNLSTYNSDVIEISKKNGARDVSFTVAADGSVQFQGNGK